MHANFHKELLWYRDFHMTLIILMFLKSFNKISFSLFQSKEKNANDKRVSSN